MQFNIQETLDFAKRIALETGKIALKYQTQGFQVSHKDVINNLVTEADIACENFLLSQISSAYPTHSIIAEESGKHLKPSPYTWYVDPIDGTTNFAHKFPFFAISIALEYTHDSHSEIIIAVTYAPLLKELFATTKNLPTYLNDTPVQVSTNQSLELSLLATGVPSDKESIEHQKAVALFTKTQQNIHGVRRLGSACLDLAYTACGRLDGFFEIGLKPWDTASGLLLVQNAHGTVTTLQGNPFSPNQPSIIATNTLIHQPLLEYLQ